MQIGCQDLLRRLRDRSLELVYPIQIPLVQGIVALRVEGVEPADKRMLLRHLHPRECLGDVFDRTQCFSYGDSAGVDTQLQQRVTASRGALRSRGVGDPPPLKWSSLSYGFLLEGGPRCR